MSNNRIAQENKTQINWSLEVDTSKRFIPEDMNYLRFLSVYPQLSPVEILNYNQTLGLALCEQFIVLEETLLVPIFDTILRTGALTLSAERKEAIRTFIREEVEHSDMFWRLLQKARPEWYETRALRISRYSFLTNAALATIKAQPQLFTCWIWLAMFLEERTLDISKRFARDPKIEPLFAAVHRRHMEEEMTHVSLDRALLKEWYAPQGYVKRALNAQIFKVMLKRYTQPYYGPLFCLEQLARESPTVRRQFKTLKEELTSFSKNQSYQSEFFSRRAFPQSYSELDGYPEMSVARAVLPRGSR